MPSPEAHIRANTHAHDAMIHRYAVRHGEIFNAEEQLRLRSALEQAAQALPLAPAACFALDVGSGSGNVTRHLVDLGFRVTAADVSQKALALVKQQFPQVRTEVLNGKDLARWGDGTFHVVTAYSVLHHVPDYRALVREMLRVLAPGGVLFLDHEHAEVYWKPTREYEEFLATIRAHEPFPWRKLLDPWRYYSRLRKLFQPRFQLEGDIHVFHDDHISWENLRKDIVRSGCKLLKDEDYLLCKASYHPEVYQAYRDRCADMHILIAQKHG